MQQERRESNYLVHCVQEVGENILKLQQPTKLAPDETSSKLMNCTNFLKDIEEKEGGFFY